MKILHHIPWSGSVCFLSFLCATLFSAPGYFEPWGKDANLVPSETTQAPAPRKDPLSWTAEKLIAFHTHILSPVDGPRSDFRPTSSRYMLMAIRRHGFFKGFVMGCDRLMRENKDDWVYRTKVINGVKYKWDPTY
ncbi:MAG: membrane protein insertion efficiency factor YidD [Chlamydiia bacterium]|nr:membrane protein insertion efficiency factor YidD [Chlamydiia bacterium]